MAIGAALKDKARLLRNESLGERVEGSTRFVSDVPGPWFAARLRLPQGAEAQDAAGGRRRSVRSPTMMCAKRDELRGDVVLRAADRIEVWSPALFGGDEPVRFEVAGDPQPTRKRGSKRSSLLFWTVPLKRVEPDPPAALA